MKNKILTVATIAAMGIGAYVYNQQGSESDYNVLDYIPADTPIFAGQLEPFPLKDYLSSAPNLVNPEEIKQIDAQYNEGTTTQEKFFLSLKKTYQSNLDDPDKFIKTFGLADDVRAYFYTLGLLPVIKIEISDPKAVWTLLDNAEKESGFTHTKGKLEGVDYRSYLLFEQDEVSSELIFAMDNGLLTITLNTPHNKPALLAQALGLTKAESSLKDSKILHNIIEKYNFKDASVGFINNMELMKGLASKDGNQLAEQITALNKLNDQKSDLSTMRSPECNADFNSIAKNWPRTVFGYKDIAITAEESTLEFSSIIESNNKVVLGALSALQGFIPNYTQDLDNLIFAMGLGIDVSQVSNSMTSIWKDLQTPKYTCPLLANLQKDLEQNGGALSMIGMGANMANGVQGVSFSFIDYAIHKVNGDTELASLDFILSVAAKNPEMLFNSLKMFTPELRNVNLKNDGKAVDISFLQPELSQNNIKLMLAIKGEHLVVYTGEKGKVAAETLASEKLLKNDLYSMSFDFKRMVEPVITASEMAGEPIPDEAMFMTEYDARMKMNMEVTEQGIVFNSLINNKSVK